MTFQKINQRVLPPLRRKHLKRSVPLKRNHLCVHDSVETMNVSIEVESNPINKFIDHVETTIKEPYVESHVDSHVEPNVETFVLTSSGP